MLANEDRKRGKGRRGREAVNENCWLKTCDIINNCSENRYAGTGLQFFQTGAGPEIGVSENVVHVRVIEYKNPIPVFRSWLSLPIAAEQTFLFCFS